VTFESHDLFCCSTWGNTDIDLADMDGDGDLDVVSASAWTEEIIWYENTDGQGLFGRPRLVATAEDRFFAIQAVDMDGDGDRDILTASGDDKVAWYRNIDGRGTFGPQQIISTQVNGVSDVHAADMDGDGDLDVLSASSDDHKIAWYENIDGLGSFGVQQLISTEAREARSVHAADVDGDGDLDVLSASSGDSKIAWYENVDASGEFGSQQIISRDVMEATLVQTADIDQDGNLDVLSVSIADRKIAWYDNADGSGSFDSQHVVSLVPDVEDVHLSDLDDDGDVDVLVGSLYDGVVWYENVDGAGAFDEYHRIDTYYWEAQSVHAADVDADGDLDLIAGMRFFEMYPFASRLEWYDNIDGHGQFDNARVISNFGTDAIDLADLDGDDDLDLLTASYGDDKVAWFENTDGKGSFGGQLMIAVDAIGANDVHAADMNGDGNLDVVSGGQRELEFASNAWLAWYRNTDVVGTFQTQQKIGDRPPDGLAPAVSFWPADMDDDGDVDILVAQTRPVWLENTDGVGTLGNPRRVTEDRSSTVVPADVDGDGDLDVISANNWRNLEIVWYENQNGQGVFADARPITSQMGELRSILLDTGDLDGDGDLDLLVAADQMVWYENLDGGGGFGDPRPISTVRAGGVDLADMDGDGDLDVLSVSDELAWYENTSGGGIFEMHHFLGSEIAFPRSVQAGDLDGDGDLDLVWASVRGRIGWYENRLLGDANDDGVFDSSDMVKIFVAGKYEDGIPHNATFDEGDWNHDGDFDSSDIVLAFQAGHYEVTSPMNAPDLAAAVDWLFAQDQRPARQRAYVA
jgi:hypothetical protein